MPVWDNVLLEQFFREGVQLSLTADEIVYDSDDEPDSVFLIQDGYVKSYTIDNGGEFKVLNFYGPGSIFPLSPALRTKSDGRSFMVRGTIYFECMTGAVLYKRNTDEFLDYINSDPGVYKELMYCVLSNYEMHLSSAEALRFRTARNRIVHQLLTLADRFGAPVKEGIRISLPITHQDLSDNLGMARETVTREFENLRYEGYIETSNQCIFLPDLDELNKLLET